MNFIFDENERYFFPTSFYQNKNFKFFTWKIKQRCMENLRLYLENFKFSLESLVPQFFPKILTVSGIVTVSCFGATAISFVISLLYKTLSTALKFSFSSQDTTISQQTFKNTALGSLLDSVIHLSPDTPFSPPGMFLLIPSASSLPELMGPVRISGSSLGQSVSHPQKRESWCKSMQAT